VNTQVFLWYYASQVLFLITKGILLLSNRTLIELLKFVSICFLFYKIITPNIMKKDTQRKIKIAIADELQMMRQGFISVLSHFKEFEIIGEFRTGKALIDALKSKAIEPDIVLLDTKLPVMNGYEALEIICKRFSDVKVIIVSMDDHPSAIIDLIARGARSFISKDGHPDNLIKAINGVFRDGQYFDQNISELMLQELKFEKIKNPFTDAAALSDKEIAVMKGVCDGETIKEMAKRLCITTRTIDYHKSNIHRKIKSKKVADVVKYAIRHGIIHLGKY
jgi:DNA-binding NarL/FixJ family response regulator